VIRIIYNHLGFGLVILAAILGGYLGGQAGHILGWGVFGGILLVGDLLARAIIHHRTRKRDREPGWILWPRAGGHVGYVPVWIWGTVACLGVLVAFLQSRSDLTAQGVHQAAGKENKPAEKPANLAKKAPAKIRLSNESFDVAFAKQERGHRVTVTSKHQRDLENLFLAASVLDGERSIDGWAWPRSTWKAGESRMTNLPVNLQGSSFRLSGDARDADGTLYEIECLWPLNP